MPRAGKTGVIEQNPNTQNVRFAGKYLNLSAIARAQGLHPSYLSYVFSGRRNPSYETAKKLAAILGMSLDDFSVALHDRIKEVQAYQKKVVELHLNRVASEDQADLDAIKQGKTPAPRLPALRSA